jgi:hypothetical protein
MTLPLTGSASAGRPAAERTTWAQRMHAPAARCMSRPAELDARPHGKRPARNSRTSRIQRAARI